jgi:osmotically-inducible protein OsmY
MAHPYDDRYREGHHAHRGERSFGREDRGFFERAGDEVRSWFGHDEAEHRRHQDEERARRERMSSERGWTPGERSEGPDRWREGSERWRAESERWRPDPGRWQNSDDRTDYERSPRAWSEPGYGRGPDDGRPMAGDRWRAGEESRNYADRWRDNTWGPATWAQSDRWRRETGDYADRTARESNWGAWPREQGWSQEQRPMGESRGYYEDDRGMTHQFSHHREQNYAGRGPKNYRRSDERVREEICDRLTDDSRIDASDIEVTVNNGQVSLSGSVNSREEKRKAEDLIEAIPGVHDVHNNLRVSRWEDSRYDRGASGANSGVNTGGNTGAMNTSGAGNAAMPANQTNTAGTTNTRR